MIRITQCPKCQASFRVTEEQLNIAQGLVVCNQCQSIFQAMEHLRVVNPSRVPVPNQLSAKSQTTSAQVVKDKPVTKTVLTSATDSKNTPTQPKSIQKTITRSDSKPESKQISHTHTPPKTENVSQSQKAKVDPESKSELKSIPGKEQKKTLPPKEKPKKEVVKKKVVKRSIFSWLKALFSTPKSGKSGKSTVEKTEKKEVTDPLTVVTPLGKRDTEEKQCKTNLADSSKNILTKEKESKNDLDNQTTESLILEKLSQLKPDLSKEDLRKILHQVMAPTTPEAKPITSKRLPENHKPVSSVSNSILSDDMTLIPVAGLNGSDEIVYMPIKKADLVHHTSPYIAPVMQTKKDETNWTVATIVALIILVVQMFYLILQK